MTASVLFVYAQILLSKMYLIAFRFFSECPTSPLSTASALTPSPMAAASPHFTETDLHNNISDLLSFGNDTFPIKLDDLTTEVLLPGAESVL